MNSDNPALARALDVVENAGMPSGPGNRLSWDDYQDGLGIFANLVNIRGFSLVLDISPIPELSQGEVASKLATEMYGLVLKAIQEAGFFKEDALRLSYEPSIAGIIYGDDRYDFAVRVSQGSQETQQATLTITRTGSRFEDFHSWYANLSGQFPEIVKGVLRQLQDITGREIRAFRGSFQFSFLLHEFVGGDAKKPARNSDLMKKILRGVPGDDGALTESDEVLSSAGRMDVSLSRWVSLQGTHRLERYILEAPANKGGAGLWLQFSYGGETHKLEDERVRFDADRFVAEGAHAYVTFLRDKALNRFLTSLLQDVAFRSATDSLP